jgi:hypothetical protein
MCIRDRFGIMAFVGCVVAFATYITAWILPVFFVLVVAWIFSP